MASMKSYQCRRRGTNWSEVEGLCPQDAVESFAEEEDLEYGEVVEVREHGRYRIKTRTEWNADLWYVLRHNSRGQGAHVERSQMQVTAERQEAEAVKECCYCTDPKGDVLCEKCADEIYDRDEPGDEESWQFATKVIALAFSGGLLLGFLWGRWAAQMAG